MTWDNFVFALAVMGVVRLSLDIIHFILRRRKRAAGGKHYIMLGMSTKFKDIIESLCERTNEKEPSAIIGKALAYYDAIISNVELGASILIEEPDGEVKELEIK